MTPRTSVRALAREIYTTISEKETRAEVSANANDAPRYIACAQWESLLMSYMENRLGRAKPRA